MGSKWDIEKFTGSNDFGLWKVKMKALLIHHKCVEALKGIAQMPATLSDEEKKDMDEKALSSIILCLGDKVLREVAKETSAAAMWSKLDSLYMTKSLAHKQLLKQQLYFFRMVENKSIGEQLSEFNKIVDDLANIDVNLEDEDKAFHLLCAFPKSLENLKDALLFGKEGTITLDEVQSALRTKELSKFKDLKIEDSGEGLNVARGRSEHKGKGKGKKYRSKSRPKGEGGSKFKCYHCHEPGHFKKDCPKRNGGGGSSAQIATSDEGYESAGALAVTSWEPEKSWVMDSGCSYHMCPRKEYFETLELKEDGVVRLGNDKACKVQGVGTIRLKMFDDRDFLLKNVRYIPELKRNLISISMFDGLGYSTRIERGVMRISHGALVIAKGSKMNGLYILEGSTVISNACVTSVENADITKLWHLRLGHVSERGLVELAKQGLLGKEKLNKLDFCDNCTLGKQHKVKFGVGVHKSSRPFEYVHSDLWGPASVSTHGGGSYFLSIIDDYSRRVWVHIIKNKSDTFEKFKEWHTLIENQTGTKLKVLRTDNGLEFVSEQFNEFCRLKGIKRHRTVAYTPQQNGLAERMNRTLLERVRCMLLGAGLPKSFWGEAVNTAAYLINRCPSTGINLKTPMEVWSGRPSDYSNLKIFGCLAFAHIKQDKLDARAVKCVFIGYPDGVKGYKLWMMGPGRSKFIISRDVTFDETRMGMKCKDLEERPETGVEEIQFEVEPSTDEREKEDQTQVPEESGSDESTTSDYQLARDRERRVIRPPNRLGYADLICYALNAAEEVQDSEPKNFREALESIDGKDWLKAMNEEMLSLEKNQTWKLVPLPKNKRVVGSKWVFKKKDGIPGVEAPRYKARLVAKGFTQVEGIDYNEIFSPVVKHCSIRVLMAIVNQYDLELEQMDVKTAFLHGELEETIYMQQPEGFVEDKSKVCLLKKSLYGLKQSPRQWYRRFDEFLLKGGFVRSNYDSCVYMMKRNEKVILYLLLYVDDILMASSDKHEIQKLKEMLNGEFEMKDLGSAKRILGMDILRDRSKGELFLSQHDYLKKVVERFRMSDSKVVNTPLGHHSKLSIKQCPQSEDERKKMESTPYASGVGSIMYGMVCSRPDLSYAISVVSRFMANPGQVHWQALKWVLRYLNGSLKGGLKYKKIDPGKDALEGYVDADYAGNVDTRKSLSGFVFTLFGTAVTWKANQQSVVALSTTQAEYIALVEGVKEAIWLKGMIGEMGIGQGCVKIHCDSQSAIHLANHQVYHERTKHIDIRLHFVRDMIESKEIIVEKVASEENPADMFTKSLPRSRFKHCLDLINFIEE
ncbi:secreted RxLR effector protein [Trifolium repens]|nr:secreted RxLR effector protein [Trifolium repens]KAK2438961.1 secreted RxLR effector protein [Trifolium repens]KAK2454516.1 secreted RxLR effector protein [Trifolium repens]